MRVPFLLLISCILLFATGCSTDDFEILNSKQNKLNASGNNFQNQENSGSKQISGVGFFAEATECGDPSQLADFALTLTGDLEGCLYVFVEDYDCSPSGTYRESGREYFVGTYQGESGSFWTTYKFEAKYEGCSDDGFFLGAEIFGRCQHPLVKGSGEGIFEGVVGRLSFKDDVVTGALPYTGHLK